VSTAEQRLREELRRAADQVDPGCLRPLREPARRRVRRRWLVPAGAVTGLAAVAGVILLLASLASGARPAPAASGARPSYYVSAADAGSKLYAYVRDSADGRVTGSVLVPVPVVRGRSVTSWSVVAAADERHFVIATSAGGDLPGVATATLFRLTISGSGQPGRLTKLSFDNRGEPVTGLALSPDGGSLAVSVKREFPPDQGTSSSVDVIDLATGGLRTWSVGTSGYWAGVPLWGSDGRTVMFPWWYTTASGESSIRGVAAIDTAASAAKPAPLRMTSFPAPLRGISTALLTAGGQYLVGSSCTAGKNDTATARILELSAADGRLERVLRTQTSRFRRADDASQAVALTCSVLSADPSGRHLLTQAFTFGRIDDGAFRALPGASADERYAAAAW
jgi:hypothetical protein